MIEYIKEIKSIEKRNEMLLNELAKHEKELKQGVDVSLNRLRIDSIKFYIDMNLTLITAYRKEISPK